MVKTAITSLTSTKAAIAGALWLILYTAANLWPASFWFEVKDLRVLDATRDQPITLYVNRTIHRPFQATWTATVKSIYSDTTVVACSTSATNNYATNSVLPTTLTLGWWTNGTCKTLPQGKYILETTWVIDPAFTPAKSITVSSNIFTVL